MRGRKARLILPTLLVALALCLVLCACDDSDDISVSYEKANAYVVAERASLSADVSALEIDWINGAVVVERGEPNSEIEFYEVTEGAPITYDTTMRYLVDGFTLHIKYAKPGRVSTGLKKYLYVRVPAQLRLGEIEIDSVGAAITVRDVLATEVDCSSRSGAIIVKCNAMHIDVDNISGDVNVESWANSVDVTNRTGRSSIVCCATPRNLEVETDSGDVLLRLAGDIGFRLEFETHSGIFVNAFTENTVQYNRDTYVYLGGGCDYEVETRSGSLTIEKYSQAA